MEYATGTDVVGLVMPVCIPTSNVPPLDNIDNFYYFFPPFCPSCFVVGIEIDCMDQDWDCIPFMFMYYHMILLIYPSIIIVIPASNLEYDDSSACYFTFMSSMQPLSIYWTFVRNRCIFPIEICQACPPSLLLNFD